MNKNEINSVDVGNSEGTPPNAEAKRPKERSGPSTAIRAASTLAFVGAVINLILAVGTMISGSPVSLVFFLKAALMFAIGKGLRKEDKLYAWVSVIFSGIFAILFVARFFVPRLTIVSVDIVLLWIATIIVCIKWKEFY